MASIRDNTALAPAMPLHEDQVRCHLDIMLRSTHFDGSIRSRQFLKFVVEESLAGRSRSISQTTIAMQVFGRGTDFDAVLDPIVRVQAGRLRRSLERYYLLAEEARELCIQLPKGCYAPVFVAATPQPEVPQQASPALLSETFEWPEMLMQPFTSEAAEQSLAAHIRDEFAMELCRYDDVRIVRAEAGQHRSRVPLRFELLGSVRAEQGNRIVCAHLLDHRSGQQIWSDQYRGPAEQQHWSGTVDPFVQAMAARIAGESGVIARALAADCADAGHADADRSQPLARAYRFLFSRRPEEIIPAIHALRALTQRAPELATGWTYLARLFVMNHSLQISTLYTPIEKGIELAYRAVTLDPDSMRARSVLASALLVKGEVTAARQELEQVLRRNPDSLVYRETIGCLLALCGEWDTGVAMMREVMRRNPYCLPLVHFGLWVDHVRREDFESAYRTALECRDPGFFWRDLMIACSLGHLDRASEAQAHVAELKLARPQFRVHGSSMIGYYVKPRELRERIADGLHKAGLTLT